jgi:hypothetical protein
VQRGDFSLPDLAPVSRSADVVANPVLNYQYHEDIWTKNQDRIQMIIQYRTLNLDGYELKDPDEDAALATGHYLTYPVDSIWPKTRLSTGGYNKRRSVMIIIRQQIVLMTPRGIPLKTILSWPLLRKSMHMYYGP